MRHELKYVITPAQYYMLKGRLQFFLKPDANAGSDGNYFIRSIYFDSAGYRALSEKESGIDNRRKYRLRFYNGNPEKCSLECKIKRGTRIDKQASALTGEEATALIQGSLLERYDLTGPLGELLVLERSEGFRPVVVVDYLREAYVYLASNVRITFDKEIAAGSIDAAALENCLNRKRCLPNVLPEGHMILEVKYDQYLPEHISHIIGSVRPVQTAASKYVMCANEKLEGRIR